MVAVPTTTTTTTTLSQQQQSWSLKIVRMIALMTLLQVPSLSAITTTTNHNSNNTMTNLQQNITKMKNTTTTTTTTAINTTTIEQQSAAATGVVDTDRLFRLQERVVVTNQAMGARCAVAADFDGDGRLDLVSASSNDNAVSWYRNEGPSSSVLLDDDGTAVIDTSSVSFSIKRQITWSSLGSRIVTVADIDGDGDVDVIGASYYDSSLRWFENDGTGDFTPHLISSGVNEGQGVTVADLDNDGYPDIATASSGDNTIAVFKNLGNGVFCEIKHVVDNDAVGARTVVAADLNGDGWIDLASASKDDDTVAWYPNDGTGHFPTKIIISAGIESKGAYSLVATDVDQDGNNDLIVASNGNDHVSLWRNVDGNGTNFTKTLIFDQADFVLSVTAVDFDRDGDIDVASASFFDGHINWYENVDGKGYEWKNHTIYVGIQGHYVSNADMDGDGDDDLIAVTHAENTVAVFLARTGCDNNDYNKKECCHEGTEWNGTACEPCKNGTYGVGSGNNAKCVMCPTDDVCVIPGLNVLPATCSSVTNACTNLESNIAKCSCPANTMKGLNDACELCPGGQIRPNNIDFPYRRSDSIGNYTLWEIQQGVCYVKEVPNYTSLIVVVIVIGILLLVGIVFIWWKQEEQAKADALWIINEKDIKYDDPVFVLGRGSFGEVMKGYYRGTAVAVKCVLPAEEVVIGSTTKSETRTGSRIMSRIESGVESLPQNSLIIPRSSSSAIISKNNNNNNKGRSSIASMIMSSSSLESKKGGGNGGLSYKEIRDSFIEEMRTLSKLRHPCITTVMGAVLTTKKPLLVMEYMEQGSLRDLLSNQTFPLDAEQTLPLIRDILQGMRFLHAADPPIIHGDLKCANVLVDSNYRAKIADFGLSSKQKSGIMVGTPFWMAPELLHGEPLSTKSDVYAFGVLLWEVMTHKIPYDHLDEIPMKDILNKVKEGGLRPDCNHGLDKELVECMQNCWAQEKDNRPSLQDLEMTLIPLCGQNFYSVMQERHKTTNKQSTLLHDVFPEHIAKALLAGKKVAPEQHDCVTIYFSDIVGFTTISSTLSASEVSDLLDRLYIAFDELAEKHGVFKLETIGDAWVGVTNLTQSQNDDHAARIARFSIDAVRAAQATMIHPNKTEMGTVKIRVGFHSGPVVSNVVGTRNPRYCLFGDTMNTASRMESTSKELRIQCSETAANLAREQDNCLKIDYRGKIEVKGKGVQRTFWVSDGSEETTGSSFHDSQVLHCSSEFLTQKKSSSSSSSSKEENSTHCEDTILLSHFDEESPEWSSEEASNSGGTTTTSQQQSLKDEEAVASSNDEELPQQEIDDSDDHFYFL